MFQEYLAAHSLRDLIREENRLLYPPAGDRDAWAVVPEETRQEVLRLAEEYRAVPWPMRTASDFLAFVRTGSRTADETPYFTRRRKLCAAVMEQCVRPDADLTEAVDGIWMICEETAWVISAHNINPIPGAPTPAEYPLPDPDRIYIDLFSAQTGMILSLCSALLGDRLDAVSPVLRRRIQSEIRRRILRPFMENDDFWWMGFRRKDLINWTPWIISNIMVSACLDPMPGEELAALLERACGMLDRYLAVLPADGGCDEGAGYWNMAGGALLDCLCILEKVTDGVMSFRDDPLIRNIMAFPRRAALSGGWFMNFADCDARPFISGERLERAGEMIGDPALCTLGTRMRGQTRDQLSDVPHLTRALDLMLHPALELPEDAPAAPKDEYLPNLQVRVLEKGRWILACKGGHNGESHNHNDVGTFILLEDGEPVIVDAGNMTYTAKTFSDERYTLWNVRSEYHNLPLIGGVEQRVGTQYAASGVEATPDGLALDISGAYPEEAGVKALRRSLSLTPEGLTLRDEGCLEKEERITWVFMLRNRPVLQPSAVQTGSAVLTFPEEMRAEAEEIPVTDARMARNWPGSLWRLKITGAPADSFRTEFRVSVSPCCSSR